MTWAPALLLLAPLVGAASAAAQALNLQIVHWNDVHARCEAYNTAE
jgi:2',3'-cyclic-nucleotide 2'-phosphodiesterase (5'-nucleotidase family)